MSYLVLARKWRPQTFDELVGQDSIARILINAITQNKVAHAYIFSGPRGVGKTSTARILAKALNCIRDSMPEPCGTCASCLAITDGSSMDAIEIDGASNTGVDNIRELRERIRYAPSSSRYKVYIIDEAHMLSSAAFNALLKTLEEPPAHVIFVLATTEPRRIPPTVLSRCQHLPFRRVPKQKIRERLIQITAAESLHISDKALDMIARAGDGSIRDSLTILDQITSLSEDISADDIKNLLGFSDVGIIAELVQAVINGNGKRIVEIIADSMDKGTDLRAFTKDLILFVRNLLITLISGNTGDLLDLSDQEHSEIMRLSTTASEEHIALILSELIKTENAIRSATHPRIALEMALIRLSLLSHFTSIGDALKSMKNDLVVQHIPHKTSPPAPHTPLNISSLWESIICRIEETNQPLASKLREGTASFSDNEITLIYNGGLSVHAESVREHLPAIHSVIESMSEQKVSIKISTAKIKSLSKKDLKEQALSNPIVIEAMELFEGRIVDVIPIKDRGGIDV